MLYYIINNNNNIIIIAVGIGILLACLFCFKCIIPCFRSCRNIFSSFMPSSQPPSENRRLNVPSRPPPRPPVPSYEMVTLSRNRAIDQDTNARRSLRNPACSVKYTVSWRHVKQMSHTLLKHCTLIHGLCTSWNFNKRQRNVEWRIVGKIPKYEDPSFCNDCASRHVRINTVS